MNGGRATSKRAAKTRFLDLPRSIAEGDRVVFGHDPFTLYAEHPIQIRPADTPEGSCLLFRRNRELAVERLNVVLTQESIGRFERVDSCQPKLLR